MSLGSSRPWARWVSWLAVGIGLVACATEAGPAPREHTGQASSAVFAGGGFEGDIANQAPPPPWVLTEALNPNPGGVTIQTPQTKAGLNLVAQGGACVTNANCINANFGTCQGGTCKPSAKTIVLAGANQPDPTMGATASLRWPRYGADCALINQLGNKSNVNQLSQTMTVGAGDVDPTDGKVHVRLVVAPVLQDPGHPANQQPYFFVQVTNVTQANAVLYANFNFSNQAGVPWKSVVTGGNTYRYTDWQLIDVAPGSPAINMGDTIELDLIAAGCAIGGHMGELYVDGVGTTLPGLFVNGTAAAQANPGANLTYTLSYKNGSAAAETGVVITFTTPPNTTYQSFTAPAGATCTVPAVGTAGGTITCTFTGPVPAGAAGSMTVTVAVDAAATGSIVEGNYDIGSTQETPLLGNVITTQVGCTADAQCPAGDWCNESGNACTPTLANGVAIPSDPPHANPALDGTCTAGAGTLVCTSQVCDTTDNRCGYLNGDGSCTTGAMGNGGVVCRSGACDPDGKCGYANGDGPCDGTTGPVVCRSGTCSVNGKCEPAGGCNVDADCTAGNWCNESVHTCTAQLPNGTAIPNDPPHTNPALGGVCTMGAGALVCVSQVCDTKDNRCGYLNGDGSCTAGAMGNGGVVCRSGACDPDGKCGYATGDGPCDGTTGPVVCRSGMCSTNGTCEPSGGCDVDADCTGGNWCDESVHTCTAKIANGGVLPSDPGHATPTLDGTCNPGAAMLVCVSGVCDGDNRCGLRNGVGTCSPGDAGAPVCRSGVCDPDQKCGYANGDGPCSSSNGGTVCRSGICCSTGGTGGVCVACNTTSDCPSGEICSPSQTCVSPPDAGTDAGPHDAGTDAAPVDAAVDAGSFDASESDGGGDAALDGPSPDGSSEDASASDGASPDGTTGDAADAGEAGSLQGGGCACTATGANDTGNGAPALGAFSLLGAFAARRRRGRRATG